MSSEYKELRVIQEIAEETTEWMEALGWEVIEINGRFVYQHSKSGVQISEEQAEEHYMAGSEPPPF